MRKGGPVLRALGSKQIRIKNRRCSHCLSTPVPPAASSTTLSTTDCRQTKTVICDSQRILRRHSVSLRGISDSASSGGPQFNLKEEPRKDPDINQEGPTRIAEVITPAENEAIHVENVFKGLETEFPCLTRNKASGPEPSYDNTHTGYTVYQHTKPYAVRSGRGILPELNVAYETWGTLNEAKDNAVLLQCGLSASSHAKSHQDNPNPGWWENFIGPDGVLDTDKFFIICANNLGGCNGTTGPSSINPLDSRPYATKFPVFHVDDIVSTQFSLLDHLGIDKLYATVGSSLGGMMSLTSAVMHPDRVNKVVTISACAQSHPSSIAMRYIQRKSIMTDPDWQKGYYYNTQRYPTSGMKMAREIATLTYRSGPEWEQRFGRDKIDDSEETTLCPTFMIENYLEHQGETSLHKLDPNTLLYISKAMDLFDLGEMYGSLEGALGRVTCPVMVIGVQSDILFPVWQQRKIASTLKKAGNQLVTYYELNSLYGHDTFLLDLNGVGAGVKGFMETNLTRKS